MALAKEKYRVAIVAPTSFFYQAPIYRELAANDRIDLMVYFCSDEAVRSTDVRLKFQTDEQWGDEDKTLDGYNHKWIRNYSPRPSYLRWPFGLMNFGIWGEIRKTKPDAVVIMSWVNMTDLFTISACLVHHSKLLIMTDANVLAEARKPNWKSWIKQILLGNFVFQLADGFLCAGIANKQLYQKYKVPEEKLVPFAFSWESKDFLAVSPGLMSQRTQLRSKLGIPQESYVILYCGRFSDEKAPLHLLRGYERVKSPHKALVYVGDGKLKGALEEYTRAHDIESVYFFGFQNRKEIGKFYAIADALVVPSLKEATGAVITEALCFGLPVIISDQVGFGMDLVVHGSNGFIFPVGDTEALAEYITRLIDTSEEERSIMAALSLELVTKWSQLDLAGSLLQHLDLICSGKSATDG